MKIFNTYFLMFVAYCCLFVACSDDDYQPGAPAEGEGFFFSNTLSSKINLDSKATSFEVQLGRSVTGNAATANLTVEDPSGKFTIPTSVEFAADAATATLTISYDPTIMEYDDYITVTLSLKDAAQTTPYGLASYTFSAGIPAPWKTLGKAAFRDAFVFEKTYQVELQQNEDNPDIYRLVNPYAAALKAEELPVKDGVSPSEYLTFRLLHPGNVLGKVTISGDGLVYFDPCTTGYYDTEQKQVIELDHPALFSSLATEESWQYNKVTTYQADGTPAVVQLAPMYYMDGIGGYNYTQKDDMITIVFPGYVVADYSVSATYTGRYTDIGGTTYATANVTLGKDVESAKVGIVKGNNLSDAVAGIINGTLESIEITKSESVSIPCGEAGMHSIVVVSYGKDEAQKSGHATFHFPDTGVSKWKSLGMAEYTDAFVAPAYGATDYPTYNVEVEENENIPGVYRLVNPYGAAYPYNEKGDWDDSRDYYMEINASDPDGVYITVQNTGLNWGDGNFYVYSYAAYNLDNGVSLEDAKAEGLCGKMENGVITFPAETLLYGFLDEGEDFGFTGEKGEFKLVLPSATVMTANVNVKSKISAKMTRTARQVQPKRSAPKFRVFETSAKLGALK